MAQKNYDEFAIVFGKYQTWARTREKEERVVLESLMNDFLDILEKDNSQFDRNRFLEKISASSKEK